MLAGVWAEGTQLSAIVFRSVSFSTSLIASAPPAILTKARPLYVSHKKVVFLVRYRTYVTRRLPKLPGKCQACVSRLTGHTSASK